MYKHTHVYKFEHIGKDSFSKYYFYKCIYCRHKIYFKSPKKLPQYKNYRKPLTAKDIKKKESPRTPRKKKAKALNI